MTEQRRSLGAAGEAAVASWYVDRGYALLAQNWRCREGELDLVMGQGRDVIFCEVKTRTSDAFGAPVEAVGREKQMRIRRLAAKWIDEVAEKRPTSIRFDVASVLAGEIAVIEGAF